MEQSPPSRSILIISALQKQVFYPLKAGLLPPKSYSITSQKLLYYPLKVMLLGCGGFTLSYQSDFQHFEKSPTTEADIVLFFRQISGIHFRHTLDGLSENAYCLEWSWSIIFASPSKAHTSAANVLRL